MNLGMQGSYDEEGVLIKLVWIISPVDCQTTDFGTAGHYNRRPLTSTKEVCMHWCTSIRSYSGLETSY